MDKVVYFNELFSCYGGLLTNREQDLFELYYEENLSMGEIAQLKGISRSGVGASIKKIEEKLEHYEKVIHKRFMVKKMSELNDFDSLEGIKEAITNILNNYEEHDMMN
ncbi:MAG: DNA-binding protein [Bacilli bacterium]|nr:DNA-binding protein [Bacilli bacterium]